jgi:hypothetical protein
MADGGTGGGARLARSNVAGMLLTAALALAAAGCTSPVSDPRTVVRSIPFDRVLGKCSIISPRTVNDVAGTLLLDVTGRTGTSESAAPGSRTICVFADLRSNSVIVGLSPEDGNARTQYATAVAVMVRPQPVAGVGEKAAFDVQGVAGRLEVLGHDRDLSVTVILEDTAPDRLLTVARALAQAVLSAL